MRINKYVALATGMSRRAADELIAKKQVLINGTVAAAGDRANLDDIITLEGRRLTLPTTTTILLNKPVGYVVSREGQGGKTIYDLLPDELHSLKPVGRLDKDSSGLLLLTNDGALANELTHPSGKRDKVYEIMLDKPLTAHDQRQIESGVALDDGQSALRLKGADRRWTVTMSEGRNRQIRRTFAACGYTVRKLHRTRFGDYSLADLPLENYSIL